MPETTIPFKDALGTNQPFRGWLAGGVVVQSLLIEDPTSGNHYVLAIDAAGKIGINALPALPAGANTIGKIDQGTGGASAWKTDGSAVTQPVSVAATVTTKEVRAATPTQTSVAASATNVTLLASNAARLGATIYNDSSINMFLKLGATASATSFTLKIAAAGYYEIPFGYTGIVDGLWDSATGSARITELAA